MLGKNVILEWSVRARFLEVFICCLFERTTSEISSIKPCFCHSVRKTVHLRKALFDISKESEMKIMIQCKMAFRVNRKNVQELKIHL